MPRVSRFVLGACLAVAGMHGCRPITSFEGEAEFPGGARGCWDRCHADGMEMASFVYVGEFSTACACRPRPAQGPVASDVQGEQAAVLAAAAGVELQRRRIEEQQRSQQQPYAPGPP